MVRVLGDLVGGLMCGFTIVRGLVAVLGDLVGGLMWVFTIVRGLVGVLWGFSGRSYMGV